MDISFFSKKINQYMAERTPLDVKALYDQLRQTCPVVLTEAFSLENGAEDYGENYPMLCGESAAGKFFLYDDGLDIIFDVEKPGGGYTHWHPADTEDAAEDIRLFLQGKCKF